MIQQRKSATVVAVEADVEVNDLVAALLECLADRTTNRDRLTPADAVEVASATLRVDPGGTCLIG